MADGTVQLELRLLPDEAERVWEALQQTRSALEATSKPVGHGMRQIGDQAGRADISSGLMTERHGHPAGAAAGPPSSALATGGEKQNGSAGTPGTSKPPVGLVQAKVPSGTPGGRLQCEDRPNLADAAVAMAQATIAQAAMTQAATNPAATNPAATNQAATTQAAMTQAGLAPAANSQPTTASGPVGGGGAERSLLFVHLKARLLANGDWEATLQDGTAMGGETLRRLACDTSLVAATVDEHGSPLHLGRKKRTVSTALMRALWMRDRHCRFPGCTHRRFVDAHHVKHWMHGGETSISNAVLLCTAHHLRLHEGGFSMTGGEDGFRFYDPDGRRIEDAPPLVVDNVGSVVAQPRSHQAHEANTDGRGLMTHRLSLARPELDGCVRALVRRRERFAGAHEKR